MSTSLGVAPRRETTPAVAKNENVGVITSSPGPMPSAISATSSASVPDDSPTACGTPRYSADLALETVDFGTADEALAVADARDRGQDLLPQGPVLPLQIERVGPDHVTRAGTISGAPQSGRSLRSSGGMRRAARAGVQDDLHLLARIRGEIDRDGNPAALGGVGEGVQRLLEQLLERPAVGDAGEEVHAVAFLVPRLGLHARATPSATRRRARGP